MTQSPTLAPASVRSVQWTPWRTWVVATLIGYAAVVFALTTLKAFFTIGLLWKPENQRTQQVRLVPFQILRDANSTFGAVFDILGNVALFVPLGVMLMIVIRRWSGVVGLAALLSLSIEVSQYVFSLGRTDVTDLICNVAGAALGAWIASWFARWPRWAWRWKVSLSVVVAASVLVFAILVMLGPALGDPNQVVG